MESMTTAEDTYIHKNNNVIASICNYRAVGYLVFYSSLHQHWLANLTAKGQLALIPGRSTSVYFISRDFVRKL